MTWVFADKTNVNLEQEMQISMQAGEISWIHEVYWNNIITRK